jgi:hypothetical protein
VILHGQVFDEANAEVQRLRRSGPDGHPASTTRP